MARVPNIPLKANSDASAPTVDDIRSELAHLSDAALADRLARAWRTYEAARRRPMAFGLWRSPRPIGNRRLDRFGAIASQIHMNSATNAAFGLVAAWLLSAKQHETFIRKDPLIDRTLGEDEIMYIQDEMARRARRTRGFS